jgi:glucose/arabinose dehydrogenase
MAIAFSRGDRLGAEYADGAFIAFHGSWNRAPLPQAGYRVVFQPFRGGKPVGEARTVAIGAEDETWLRAAGVAVGPDGALYISADKNGRVWKVVRK